MDQEKIAYLKGCIEGMYEIKSTRELYMTSIHRNIIDQKINIYKQELKKLQQINSPKLYDF